MAENQKTRTTTTPLEAQECPPGFKLRHTLRGHEKEIYRIAWSPDGRMIASPSQDKTIRLWEAGTGKLLNVLEGHSARVHSVAWSPDGRTLASGGNDNAVMLWDIGAALNASGGTMGPSQTLQAHSSDVWSVAWSRNGRFIASGSSDKTVKLWDVGAAQDGRVPPLTEGRTLGGHQDKVLCVAWSPDDRMVASASASDDKTVRVWNADSGEVVHELSHEATVLTVAWSRNGGLLASGEQDGENAIQLWNSQTAYQFGQLEGHTARIRSLSFSSDDRLLASGSSDGTVCLWDCETWELLAILEEPAAPHWPPGIAFHPTKPVLATLGERDRVIRIWDLDYSVLLGTAPTTPPVRYTNAKVVLVGDSGVGKTGLGMVMAGEDWGATESTHKRNIWLLHQDEVTRKSDGGKEEILAREVVLWDLAGQPGYRVVHQLSLTEVAVALVVFDARSETDPFAGVRHWDRALRQAQKVSGGASIPLKKYLVAARSDRGGIAASRKRIDELIEKYGFDGYFETSAKEGQSIAELTDMVKKAIQWDALPWVTSNDLFQAIKAFLLREKESGRLLSSESDLYRLFQESSTTPEEFRKGDFTAEFRTCIGLVEGRGLIRRPSFGNLVLLQPEVLDAYASSLVEAAKKEPEGLGVVKEKDAREGQFRMPKDIRIKDKGEEKLLLIAMVEDMLRHEIALREEADLVFPSQAMRDNPKLPNPEGKEVVFKFDGPVMSIYATLIVRLAHSGLFQKAKMWRNAAIFSSPAQGIFGIALEGDPDEGWGRLILFFQKNANEEMRFQFEAFVEAHLQRRALKDTIHRQRIYVCPDCEEPVQETAAKRRRERGHNSLSCPVCETPISLLDGKERLKAPVISRVDEMNAQADARRQEEVAKSIIQGKLATNDFDVFLCHNSADKEAVKLIGEALKKQGILPWLDEWNLRPGFPWQRALAEQIDNIKSAAIFVGPEGLGPWSQMEMEAFISEFVNRECPVIPVMLEGCRTEPELPVFLRAFGWVDFRKTDPDPLKQLVWGITGKNEM